MYISHKGHNNTMYVYSVTVMTHAIASEAGQSSQGTYEHITPVFDTRYNDKVTNYDIKTNNIEIKTYNDIKTYVTWYDMKSSDDMKLYDENKLWNEIIWWYKQ